MVFLATINDGENEQGCAGACSLAALINNQLNQVGQVINVVRDLGH